MDIDGIFKNNQEWVAGKLETDPDYFKKLSEGQHPEMLFIGCSDSRIPAGDIMGLQPGEAFVHRNIANLVPNTDVNVMSIVNYAVCHLEVDHIVVCGHYNCGGIKAAMETDDLGILNPWLRNINDVYRFHQGELDKIKDEGERYNRLIELNVHEQCFNLLRNTDVKKAYEENKLDLHGWVFDIHSGKIVDLGVNF